VSRPEPGSREGTGDEEVARIARAYRHFAEIDAARVSPLYAELAAGVAGDPAVLRFLAELPAGKRRQPMLLFAALRYLFDDVGDAAELHRLVLGSPDAVRATMIARATQTNEPARCAALLPVLAGLSGPLALIEVGSSAGLCLYPDRYSYSYDGRQVGPPSAVHLRCTTSGEGPVPDRLPDVVARIGIDLNPLDPTDPDDVAWLRTLIWPGPAAAERLARLDAATGIAAAEPPQVLHGDLVERLPDALALAPAGSTVVVFHTAVLMYPPRERREEFVALVRSSPAHWLAQEPLGVLPGPRSGPDDGRFVLALDGRPLARTAPHGGRIDWLPGAREVTAR
jgi:hypothetical protein